jgi:hypothetical protein
MPSCFPSLFRRSHLSLLLGTCGLAASGIALGGATPLTSRQCALMQESQVLSATNPVPCERLALVSFSYRDFSGKLHDDGSVVVLDAVAPQVQEIFNELLERKFPLQRAQPMEVYHGDDEASMDHNNSSAFNGRPITGGGAWSKHAYGVAIDINPVQNPYIGKDASGQTMMLPSAAGAYVSRKVRPGMSEQVLEVFFRHGFLIWGGYWKQPIDYQHFEIGSRDYIGRLVALPKDQARAEFAAYTQGYGACMQRNDIVAMPSLVTRRKACAGQSKR